MNHGNMKEAMSLAVDHLKWAHSVGISNREILQAMGAPLNGEEPNEFQVCGRIAQWYLTEYWDAVDNVKQ